MASGTLRLFTTIDRTWLPYACLMIKSVRMHSIESVSYSIVHDDIGIDSQRLVTEWGRREEIDIQFIHFPSVQANDRSGFLQSIEPLPAMSAGVSFGRYFPGILLPRGVTRAIYADVDMFAVGPIAPLMTLALDPMAVGAVRGSLPVPAARNAGLSESEYFNNGLLVFDVDKFDGTSCVRAMMSDLRVGGQTFGPQCAFSTAMRGLVHPFDDQWNVQMESRAIVGATAKLVHFTGSVKPWHCLSVDPLRSEVIRTLKTTPFPSSWDTDRTLRKRVRGVARRWKRAIQAFGAPDRPLSTTSRRRHLFEPDR